jgi:DNA adenine methylase
MDGEICNLIRVVRDQGEKLAEKIYLTPYSREEFIRAFDPSEDPVEQARRTMVRAFQGFGSGYITNTEGSKCAKPEHGFRVGWRIKGNHPNLSWMGVPENIMAVIGRLRGVVIEQLPYGEVIQRNNTAGTLIYADPPYMADSRDNGVDYRFEFSEAEHIELAKILHEAAGPAIVSGYHSELYNDLYHDWQRAERKARTAGNTERTEVIWIKGGERGLFD